MSKKQNMMISKIHELEDWEKQMSGMLNLPNFNFDFSNILNDNEFLDIATILFLNSQMKYIISENKQTFYFHDIFSENFFMLNHIIEKYKKYSTKLSLTFQTSKMNKRIKSLVYVFNE